jgi:hypothetical protein
MNMASPTPSPAMVPSSANDGCSGGGGGGGAATGGTNGRLATIGGGGRREGEKIGRSRVLANCFNGIAHNGFPLAACGAVERAVPAGPRSAMILSWAGAPAANTVIVAIAMAQAIADFRRPAPCRQLNNSSAAEDTFHIRGSARSIDTQGSVPLVWLTTSQRRQSPEEIGVKKRTPIESGARDCLESANEVVRALSVAHPEGQAADRRRPGDSELSAFIWAINREVVESHATANQ